MVDGRQLSWVSIALALIICLHTAVCCLSLVYVSIFHDNFHVLYDPARLSGAVTVVVMFALASSLFAVAEFSFGYFVAYYFYAMVAGYLWINYFSDLNYDHRLAGFSAAASAIAFFVPALFYTSPIRQIWMISPRAFDRVLLAITALAIVTIVVGASYNFRIIGLGNYGDLRQEAFYAHFRNELKSPAVVRYLVGITSNALLPFAFACFFARKQYWYASGVLTLLLLFFPITLSKLSLFTPVWLVVIALLSAIFESRIVVVFSLLLPMLSGLVAITLFRASGGDYFDLVDFRLMAVPSNALNVYNHFFASHELTYFCQIGVSKLLMSCPYRDQLGVLLERVYKFGNFNASLFATEGIASVGMIFAPVSASVGGLVVALGNRLSAGVPPRLALMSSPILAQALLNVPFSTAFLTHGTALIFLVWYITPRTMFQNASPSKQR